MILEEELMSIFWSFNFSFKIHYSCTTDYMTGLNSVGYLILLSGSISN